MDEMQLVKSDVTVDAIPDDECDECAAYPATHIVMIDFRSAGVQHALGRYCRGCAEIAADRIRDGLPS